MALDETWETSASPGGTLRELLAGKPLEQRRALLIVRQVLEALATVHATGKTHGDVKPANIAVTTALGTDRVTLSDPGAKKPGDPVYGAPEAALGLGSNDARADLYSVGAVLFELLTGRPPFFADEPEALRRLHAYAPVQTLKQRVPEQAFSEALETVVATALAKKRDGRFRSATEMIDAVDRALAGMRAAAPAPSASPAIEEPNDSLRLLAQDLMPRAPQARDATNTPLVPLIPTNVGRVVPQLSLSTRARLSANRVLDRLSTRFGIPRKKLLAGLAGLVGVGLILTLVMCSGSSDSTKQASRTTSPSVKPIDLPARCERLGKACGDNDKHASKIIEGCKQAATAQLEKGCAAAAVTAYDCYETTLCGKADPVWALDDLRVLAERKGKCAAEGKALRACVGTK